MWLLNSLKSWDMGLEKRWAEYEDGERFWCHYRSSDIEEMLERYSDLVDETMN